MRGRPSPVIVAALFFALAGLAFAATNQNQSAAQSDASALLAAALLPDGAVPSDGEPGGDGGVLSAAPVQPATSNIETKAAFYRSPQATDDVLAFVAAHPPSGTRLSISGSADGRDGHSVEFRAFEKPRLAHRLAVRRLLVSVARLDDGGSGIRLDAQVVWLDPRPTAMVIHGAGFLTINVGKRKLEIANPARVRRIAWMLNEADIEPPTLRFCERATKEPAHPRLTFRSERGGRVVAYAHVRPTGCARADLVVGGKRFQGLDLTVGSGAELLDALRDLGALPREAAAKQRP